jgi:magnesium-transporting ATPase (P-type)
MEGKIINIKLGFVIFVVMVLVSNTVIAFGIATPHWKGQEGELKIGRGETKSFDMTAQNMGDGSSDVSVKVELKLGFDIASTPDKIYDVPAQTKNTKIPIKVSIPADYPLGVYQVTVSSGTITEGTGGVISIGTGFETTFDVRVLEDPQFIEEPKLAPDFNVIYLVIIGVIAILGIIIVVWLVRRKKRSVEMFVPSQ